MRETIINGCETAVVFLMFLYEYAERIGDTQRPFGHETWHAAFELWKQDSGRF